MGQLLRGMGPGVFADLLPWLLATLRSEGSSVERSGAAQGLAEALAVLGDKHLNDVRLPASLLLCPACGLEGRPPATAPCGALSWLNPYG